MGNHIIRDKTFEGATIETKLNILYDLALLSHSEIRKLKNRKRVDTVVSFGGGILGGIIAVIGKAMLLK